MSFDGRDSEQDGGSELFRWAEVSTKCERERYTSLSQALEKSGLANEVGFIEITPEEFPARLPELLKSYDQLRIGGELQELALKSVERLPSALLTLRAADSLVRDVDGWWPRNFLVEGLRGFFAQDLRTIDLSGGVFVSGVTPQARAVVAALVRIGFNRFTIAATEVEHAERFADDMRAGFFQVRFQTVSGNRITQLPAVHTVAVNTLPRDGDGGLLAEMAYFNFLKSGGIWLDLPLVPHNIELDTEARSVGARVAMPTHVAVRTDLAWLSAVFAIFVKVKKSPSRFGKLPDPAGYLDLLTKATGRSGSGNSDV